MNLRYFSEAEMLRAMTCQHTGHQLHRREWDMDVWRAFDDLRHTCRFPFIIISGYRSPLHPIEAAKDRPGAHAYGVAFDIMVSGGVQRRAIVKAALDAGVPGIGVNKNSVHLDWWTDKEPMLWEYTQ